MHDRTLPVIGKDLFETLQKTRFCIVGCGGTGALFSEMLVRTGAKCITLIDGDTIDYSNLNRVVGFLHDDICKKKVEHMKTRLNSITTDLDLTIIPRHFPLSDYSLDDKDTYNVIRNKIDILILAVDKNDVRIACEKLAEKNDVKILNIGVALYEESSQIISEFECSWCKNTPPEKIHNEGYGLGSYISIVTEATSVAFSMLLHHLKNPDSDSFTYYTKKYRDFQTCNIEE